MEAKAGHKKKKRIVVKEAQSSDAEEAAQDHTEPLVLYEKISGVESSPKMRSDKQKALRRGSSAASVPTPAAAAAAAPLVAAPVMLVWLAAGHPSAELEPVHLPAAAVQQGWYLHDLKLYFIRLVSATTTTAAHDDDDDENDPDDAAAATRLPAAVRRFLLPDTPESSRLEPHQFRITLLDGRPIPASRQVKEVLSLTHELCLQRVPPGTPTSVAPGPLAPYISSYASELPPMSEPTPVAVPVSTPLDKLLAHRSVGEAVKSSSLVQQGSAASENANAILNRLVELEDKIDAKNAYFETAVKELRLLTASVRAAGGVAAMPGRNVGQILQLDAAVPTKSPKGSLENEHAGSVWALATNREQTRLASGSSDNIWDMQTLKPIQKLKGHTSIVHSLDMHGDNIISGSDDRTVRLWSAKEQYKCTKIVRSNDIPSCLKVANNLLFQGTYKAVRVFNLEPELSLLKTIDAHNHWVRALCVSNAHLFTGSHGQIVQHDMATWKAQKTMSANCGSVYSIVVTDNLLYAATYENSIYIWDLRSYTTVRTLLGHTGAIYSLAFYPSNPSKLYSGSYDTTIRQWDLASFTCSARLSGHSGSVEAMALTGDGSAQTLFSASRDSVIHYWRP